LHTVFFFHSLLIFDAINQCPRRSKYSPAACDFCQRPERPFISVNHFVFLKARGRKQPLFEFCAAKASWAFVAVACAGDGHLSRILAASCLSWLSQFVICFLFMCWRIEPAEQAKTLSANETNNTHWSRCTGFQQNKRTQQNHPASDHLNDAFTRAFAGCQCHRIACCRASSLAVMPALFKSSLSAPMPANICTYIVKYTPCALQSMFYQPASSCHSCRDMPAGAAACSHSAHASC
jgi:hypothetical protein